LQIGIPLPSQAGRRDRPKFDDREDTMGQTIREKAKIRQAREEGRLTEDEIARARLGPTPGSEVSKMTPDEALQTPSPLDPGHTA
jgi:hypothetical protein